jgi:hypothetical protein
VSEVAGETTETPRAWRGSLVAPRWWIWFVLLALGAAIVGGGVFVWRMRDPFAADALTKLALVLGGEVVATIAAFVVADRRFKYTPGDLVVTPAGLAFRSTMIARGPVVAWRTLHAFDGGGSHVALFTAERERVVVATKNLSDLEALLGSVGARELAVARRLRALGRFPSASGALSLVGVALLVGILIGGPRYAAWPLTLASASALALAIAYPLRTRARVAVARDGVSITMSRRTLIVPIEDVERVDWGGGPFVSMVATKTTHRWRGSVAAARDVFVAIRARIGSPATVEASEPR